MEKSERKSTVTEKRQARAWGSYVDVPEVRIVGKWLAEAGFKPGQKVRIEVHKKKLVLVPVKQKTPSNKR